jgi:hypothetical protein
MIMFHVYAIHRYNRICVIVPPATGAGGVSPSNKACPGRSPSQPLRYLKRPNVEIGSQSQSPKQASSGFLGGCSGVQPALEALDSLLSNCVRLARNGRFSTSSEVISIEAQ